MFLETDEEVTKSLDIARKILDALEEQEIPLKISQHALGHAWFALCKCTGMSTLAMQRMFDFMCTVDEEE